MKLLLTQFLIVFPYNGLLFHKNISREFFFQVTHDIWGSHNDQKQILPMLTFSENQLKPVKIRKFYILDWMIIWSLFMAQYNNKHRFLLTFHICRPSRPSKNHKIRKKWKTGKKTEKLTSPDWLIARFTFMAQSNDKHRFSVDISHL